MENRWTTDPEYIDLLTFIIEKTKDVKSPMSIQQMAREFNEKSGATKTMACLKSRIANVRTRIHNFENIDKNTKVKMLFALSAPVDAKFLKKIREDALVEVDKKKRITHYQANDRSLELNGDHSWSAKNRNVKLDSKRSHRSMINSYFENKNNSHADHKNEESEEMENLIEFITEKCENVNTPLRICQLNRDFNKYFGTSRTLCCITKRIKTYCHEIQKGEFLDTHSKVKQLFGLGGRLDSDCLKELRKDAVVEVDHQNRITKYTANNGRLTLHGDHSYSAKGKLYWDKKREKRNAVKNRGDPRDDEDEDSDEYSSEEFDSSDEENDALDKTEDLMQPSNEADNFDDETLVRNRSSTAMPIDDNFDFDPPFERSHTPEEIEMRGDDEEMDDSGITENAAVKTRSASIEALPKSKTSYSTSHTPKTPKRKADASRSSSSKRTKPLSEKSMNPLRIDENISHDDPSRIEIEPFRAPRGLPSGIEKDPDIKQIPKPRSQVMETPIKKEYEEGAQTELKMILNAFKSLILSLDTPGLSQFQIELDKRIMETGRRIEVPNKEVILAMEFLIIKLSKHGALESSEDSISLRDILLMLRTIILNSSFHGLEMILEMLKENIEQLKILDKKVPVTKVECVLRATIDNIST